MKEYAYKINSVIFENRKPKENEFPLMYFVRALNPECIMEENIKVSGAGFEIKSGLQVRGFYEGRLKNKKDFFALMKKFAEMEKIPYYLELRASKDVKNGLMAVKVDIENGKEIPLGTAAYLHTIEKEGGDFSVIIDRSEGKAVGHIMFLALAAALNDHPDLKQIAGKFTFKIK